MTIRTHNTINMKDHLFLIDGVHYIDAKRLCKDTGRILQNFKADLIERAAKTAWPRPAMFLPQSNEQGVIFVEHRHIGFEIPRKQLLQDGILHIFFSQTEPRKNPFGVRVNHKDRFVKGV